MQNESATAADPSQMLDGESVQIDVDLTALSAEELRVLADKLRCEADKRKDMERAAFAARIRAEIKAAGCTLEDLGFAPRAAAVSIADVRKVRRPAKPKYRNPADPSQTWTGRGKPTNWFRDALARGVARESMLIGGAS